MAPHASQRLRRRGLRQCGHWLGEPKMLVGVQTRSGPWRPRCRATRRGRNVAAVGIGVKWASLAHPGGIVADNAEQPKAFVAQRRFILAKLLSLRGGGSNASEEPRPALAEPGKAGISTMSFSPTS